MSKMTSSTTTTNENRTGKVLTDFSIDTIIGDPQINQKTSHHRDRKQAQTQKSFYNNSPANHKQVDSKPHHHHHMQQQSPVASINPDRKYRPKNFQCPACKMAFSNNGQLKNHVRIHTGERPFKCNQPDCNKTFTRNEELTRHKLIHTGVRPHSCTTCGKCFGRKDHLKKHVRTHDRKKMRKKVFVPTPSQRVYIQEDLFVPPKPVMLNSDTTSLIPVLPPVTSSHSNFTNRLLPATSDLPIPPLPSSVGHCRQLYQITSTALATSVGPTIAQTTTATSAIQQLASDYWNKWLLGLYHHQQYPTVDR